MVSALSAMTLMGVALVAAVLVPLGPAEATPVCTGDDRSLCGGRIFPEPMESLTAITYAETVEGLQTLADESNGWMTLAVIGQSFDANDIVMWELTDPDSPVALEDRKVVFVSQSIHGNEPGGREGAARYTEDLLTGRDEARRDLLDRVRLVQVILNPDGWQEGDHDRPADPDNPPDSAGGWCRGNGDGVCAGDVGGVDLNRNLPWYGWNDGYTPDDPEPETQALVDLVRNTLAGADLQVSTDIHGEVHDAAAWIMLSAGQFNLQGSMQQRGHGDAVDAAVDAALADDVLVSLAQNGLALEPGILTASSEFGSVSADGHGSPASGTGFLGDWLAQANGGDSASISTIELFNLDASPGLNSLTARREILQVYRDTVAAILGAMLDQAVIDHQPTVELDGQVGYVHDPATVTDPVLGEPRSQMAFFEDFGPFLDQPLVALAPADVSTAGALADLESLVVATDVLDAAGVAAVRAFAEDGGNVVLTDSAVQDLPDLIDGVETADVSLFADDVITTDFRPGRTDPMTAGLRDIAFLTVEPATLGYAASGGSDTPAYTVAQTAWDAAGGTTVAEIDGETGIGYAPVGDGEVTVIGHLLPPPMPDGRILYGLEEYGVLDTGYHVLINALDAELTVAPVDVYEQQPVSADVAVTLEGPTTMNLGDSGTFTATLTNAGPDPATAPTTTLTFPSAVTVDEVATGCTTSGRVVTCERSGLGVGQTIELAVEVTAADTRAATVSATVDTTSEDPSLANNTDSQAVRVVDPNAPAPAPGQAALDLIASAAPNPTVVGDVVAVTAEVSNSGDTTADGVEVEFDLPAGVQLSSAPQDCATDANVTTCPVEQAATFAGAIAADQSGSVSISVTADRAATHQVGVTATSTTTGVSPASALVAVDVVEPADETVVRVAGPDRVATALEASRDAHPDGTAGAVVLARADAFPDALAGGPLAAAENAPLLLTPTDQLDERVATEIDRVLPDGGRVYLLGGTAALGAGVESTLTNSGYDVVRLAGAGRAETAVAIADATTDAPSTIFVATGGDFPDALGAGAAAVATDGVVVLTAGTAMPDVTREYLDAHPDAEVVAVGGQAAQATPGATDLVGADRYATNALVADRFFDAPVVAGVATGAAFPDALAGVPHLAVRGGPMLLTAAEQLSGPASDYIESRASSLERVYVYGGTAAVSASVESSLAALLA